MDGDRLRIQENGSMTFSATIADIRVGILRTVSINIL